MITMNRSRVTIHPVSKREELSALKLVQSSLLARRLATVVLWLLALAIIGMVFLPWQQSAKGTGNVTAFVPQERQQTVMSQIKGVVVRVAEGMVEGHEVKRGDFIMELSPAAENLVEQLQLQLRDLREKLRSAEIKAEAYQQNVNDYSEARDFAVSAAKEMLEAARAKLRAKQELLEGYKSKEWQANVNHQRQKRLADQGVKPQMEVEKLKKDWDVAKAELISAGQEVAIAQNEIQAKEHELQEKQRIGQTKVDYARAMRQDALGLQASTSKEIRDIEIKLSEMDRLVIEAPRDGTIFRMPVFERGQTIKAGDPLFTIVPETTELVVELWLKGNDVPLVRRGDHVRLQFEGWPAVQFAGWPSVAVGTFAGEIFAIDETDNGKGKFRIQVRPTREQEWPSHRFLRQGVRVNGWVMLQRVRLGYEIWRQLNGFPPVVAEEEPDARSDAKGKKPKLPK